MMPIAGAAIANPKGIERRGLRISPPTNEIASGPVHAKAITDQKMTSFNWNPGRIVCALIGIAGPNFHHASTPSPMRINVAVQRVAAPTLLSHFPTSRPNTLTTVASVRPKTATPMKYHGESASAPPSPPVTKSALPAAKYSSAGKYGRFDVQ